MTLTSRLKNILLGIITILASLLIMLFPSEGYQYVVYLLSISLILYSLRSLVFYFTLTRFMVDGKRQLYQGIILLDLGIFSLTVADNPTFVLAFYLLFINFFSGLVDILHALESKKLSASYKGNLTRGIINISVAIASVVFGTAFQSRDMLVYIYCIGVIISAIARISNAFRDNSIVYIQ